MTSTFQIEEQKMPRSSADWESLQAKALARWENEGGATPSSLGEQFHFSNEVDRIEANDDQRPAAAAADQLREAVAVFDSVEHLQAAIDELLESGFDRAELSLLGARDTIDSKIGRLTAAEIEDDPHAPRGDYVSPEALGAAEGGLIGTLAYVGGTATAAAVALAGGPITAVILGGVLAGGAGGLVGSGLAAVLGLHRAAYFDEQISRGGLLLWVRTWTAEREERALTILRRHCGQHAHVHALNVPQSR